MTDFPRQRIEDTGAFWQNGVAYEYQELILQQLDPLCIDSRGYFPMNFLLILLVLSSAVSAQTMYRCTDPDGTHLSFRPSCPEGQVGTKIPRQIAPKIADPESDIVGKAIAIRQEQQRQAYLDRANAVNNAIAIGKILVGMDANEVVRAWGQPDKINSTINASGKSEQWVYRREKFKDRYVYLDNDVVRSIQASD